MFGSIAKKLNRLSFDLSTRQIRKSAPLTVRPAPLTFVSMVSGRDLNMYLVAITSLYRRIGEGRIVILDDGSLSASDHTVLNKQLGSPTIIPLRTIETSPCPKGGCWERLLKILELSKDSFVIQVDSDTITTGEIPEIIDCYKNNRSFTLGTYLGQNISIMPNASRLVARLDSEHVQVIAEKSFDRYPRSAELQYVRGCAGFAGFAAGAFSSKQLHEFSTTVERLIGKKWHEWGSEQVASNFLIANAPGSIVLPFPKYASIDPSLNLHQCAFLHFIGSYRFDRNVYRDLAQTFIAMHQQ